MTLRNITGMVIGQMTVPVLSSTIFSNNLTSMPLLALYVAFRVQYSECKFTSMVTQGQNYITGKNIALPKIKAKNTRTDIVRGVTSNVNFLVQ
jgi:hypothetical protein